MVKVEIQRQGNVVTKEFLSEDPSMASEPSRNVVRVDAVNFDEQ